MVTYGDGDFVNFSIFFRCLFLRLPDRSGEGSSMSVRTLLGSVRLSVRRLGCLVRVVSHRPSSILHKITQEGVIRVQKQLSTLLRLLSTGPIVTTSTSRDPRGEPMARAVRVIRVPPLGRAITSVPRRGRRTTMTRSSRRAIRPRPLRLSRTIVRRMPAIGLSPITSRGRRMFRSMSIPRPRRPAIGIRAEITSSPVLTRHVGATNSLHHSVDLGSSFHFSHRLFKKDVRRVGGILRRVNRVDSLSTTLIFLSSGVGISRRGRTVGSFMRLLEGRFVW